MAKRTAPKCKSPLQNAWSANKDNQYRRHGFQCSTLLVIGGHVVTCSAMSELEIPTWGESIWRIFHASENTRTNGYGMARIERLCLAGLLDATCKQSSSG